MDKLDFHFTEQHWVLGQQPLLMGILNVTPDSFSDGGRFLAVEHAVRHGLDMAEQGAHILDVGGESTRPGAPTVDEDEEMRRVLPVIRELSESSPVPISIDTTKACVARAAITAGASIVNDVSGLHRDPEMLRLLRETRAGCIVMHMRGTPDTMRGLTQYDDLIGELVGYFRDILAQAATAGVEVQQFMLDPGIGFAKTAEQSLALVGRIPALRELGRPVLVGPSRKSFIGKVLPETAPKDRIWGTAAAVACCVLRGADVLRVHDVAEMRQVAAVAAAIRDAPDNG